MQKMAACATRGRHGCLTIGLAGWLLAFTGCTTGEPAGDASSATYTPAPPPEPALRVASDAHLTLFGEFPEQSQIPFHARAASPMKQHSFTTEGADYDPDVSPDGQWIVFSSTRHSPEPDLYLKSPDGRAVTQLTDDPAGDVQPSFSPDGQWIAFASFRAGNWDLWVTGLQGGHARQITQSPLHEVHPSWSPDGKRLAYCVFNDVADQWELWTLQLDQPGSRRMIGDGVFPEWSPTSDAIVYQKARQRGGRWFSIWRVELELGEPKFPVEIGSSPDMALIQPGWSPDGEWITYGTAGLVEPVEPSAGPDGEVADERAAPRDQATLTRGDIWIVKADGSSSLRLTDGEGANFGSTWGADGRIYFTSRQSGSENIWSVKPLLAQVTQLPTAQDDSTAGASTAEVALPAREANQGG